MNGSFNIAFDNLLAAGIGSVSGRYQFSSDSFFRKEKIKGILWPVISGSTSSPSYQNNTHGLKDPYQAQYPVPGYVTLCDDKGVEFIKDLPAAYLSGYATGGVFLFPSRVLNYARSYISYPQGSSEGTSQVLNVYITLLTDES